MTLRELRQALRMMPDVYLDMPVYWSHHLEQFAVQVVAADPGGAGPEDHPAVILCHKWEPPESHMDPEVLFVSRRDADPAEADEVEKRVVCWHCKGAGYAPHGTAGWPDAPCDVCHGKGSTVAIPEVPDGG